MDDHLTEDEVQDYLSKIPYPGVKAVLDNGITPLIDRAEQGVWPNPDCQKACQEGTLGARPTRLATTNVIDWKLEQKEDPVLYQVVKYRKASHETFKEALLKVTDQKATTAYVKSKEQLMVAIVRQHTKVNAAPYLSCKSNSGGQVWPVTSGTASKSVVVVGNLRLPHLSLH